MQLTTISFHSITKNDPIALTLLESTLLHTGIVGICDVPQFENASKAYVDAARQFSALPETTKQQYAPNRDGGETEGYELGAEYFKNSRGEWQIDDKKASFYAYVPDDPRNRWPSEIDLKSKYLALGNIIFETGKLLLKVLKLDHTIGIDLSRMTSYGRMLHYHKEGDITNENPDWCGEHLDHDLITGLIPAFYYQQHNLVDEPHEAGLFIQPRHGHTYEKIDATDHSILLFQVGELGQLVSNDRIRATKHIVKKVKGDIDRFTFALFFSPQEDYLIRSTSVLTSDSRYRDHQTADGSLPYLAWREASFERYRAEKGEGGISLTHTLKNDDNGRI